MRRDQRAWSVLSGGPAWSSAQASGGAPRKVVGHPHPAVRRRNAGVDHLIERVVGEADSPDAASAEVDAESPDAVVDLRMPTAEGLRTVQQLRRAFPRLGSKPTFPVTFAPFHVDPKCRWWRRRVERTKPMTADRIAHAIDQRSRNRHRRRPAGVKRHVSRTSVTQEELDDKARWLDGQVRGWMAGRTV